MLSQQRIRHPSARGNQTSRLPGSRRRVSCLCAGLLLLGVLPCPGGAVRDGFRSTAMSRNDDSYVGPVSIGFNINFFGPTYGQLWVNNNGDVTFGRGLSSYTPFGLTGATTVPIIAPFFGERRAPGVGRSRLEARDTGRPWASSHRAR